MEPIDAVQVCDEILIDALNVAYWCGQPPSLRMPLALAVGLLQRKAPPVLYFDASARYRLEAETGLYERLLQHPQFCVEARSGRRADGEMLRRARAQGRCIVSCDRFRDYRSRYRRLIDDPSRVLSGFVESDRVFVPALDISAPLSTSAEMAWEAATQFL